MAPSASENTYSTPGERVVDYLGGVKATAALAQKSVKSVYRWLQPTAKGGGGGMIPLPAQRRLVRNSRGGPTPLTYADFAPRPGEVVQ